MIAPEAKKRIDAMTYKELLFINRFAPCGSEWFAGDCGAYFFQAFGRKRRKLELFELAAASMDVGWLAPDLQDIPRVP